MERKPRKENIVWDSVFEILGCPAHIFQKGSPHMCKGGYCCYGCPTRRKGDCKDHIICEAGRTCHFKAPFEKVFEVYKRKEWKDWEEFFKVVEKEFK